MTLPLWLKCSQGGLSHLHIIGVVSPADANAPNHALLSLNRIATTKYDKAVRLDNAMQQRWIILHEFKPFMYRQRKEASIK
jgi:hypothetical protein